MQRMRGLAGWLLNIGTLGYCGGIVVLAGLWTFAPNLHWTIIFTNVFAALFFVPLLLLIPLAAVLRTRLVVVAAIIPALVFAGMFGGRFIPRPPATAAAGTTLRVMSFNQLYLDSNADAIIATIRAEHPDLVAIQELVPAVAKLIQRDLKGEYPYQILDAANNSGGVGLISRFPIDAAGEVEGTRASRAILHLNGKDITVVNVHLHFSGISRVRSQAFGSLGYFRVYDTTGRLGQAEALLTESRKAQGGLIMLGDHNTGDREPGYRLLSAELHDAFGEAGWGFGYTFPNNKRFGPITIPIPLVRIDYIWTKNGVTPLAAQVNCNAAGSDHCLLVADLHVAP